MPLLFPEELTAQLVPGRVSSRCGFGPARSRDLASHRRRHGYVMQDRSESGHPI